MGIIEMMKKLLYTLFSLLILSTVSGELFRISVGGLELLPADLLIPAIFVFWGVDKLAHDRQLRLGKIGKTILVFLFVMVMTYFLNFFRFDLGQMLGGFPSLGRLGMYGLLAIVAFDLIHRDKKERFKWVLLISMMVSVFLIAVFGFLQLKYFPSFLELGLYLQGWDPHEGRLLSTWFDPNFVGGFFGFMLPLLAGLTIYYYRQRRWPYAILLAVISSVVLMALYFTFSRSAYLTLMIGLGLFALFKSWRLLVVFVIFLVLGFSFSDRVQQRTLDAYDSAKSLIGLDSQKPMDPTSKFRVDSWKIAGMLIADHPLLGVGYGRYGDEVNARGLGGTATGHAFSGSDSSLLNIWAQSGIFALLSYLAIAFVATVLAIKRIWKRQDLDSYLSLGLLSGYAGLMIHAFFVNSLLFALIMVYFWLGLALLDQR